MKIIHKLWLTLILTSISSASMTIDNETEIQSNSNQPYPSNTGISSPNPILNSEQVWSFKSEPNLHPMKVKINKNSGNSNGLIFVGPFTFSFQTLYGQTGSLIMDNDGNPVFFKALNNQNLMNTDFKVQTLNGRQVLTFCEGTFATPPVYTNVPGGSSEPGACFYILDDSYRMIKKITAQRGYIPDPHEFIITPQNTALFLATKAIKKDLTPYGGSKNGFVQDFSIQEIDIKSNKLKFFWSALDHIDLKESYKPILSASMMNNIWDPYHFNSIGLITNTGDLIVSVRHTSTIYRIDKQTGKITWRLGGKRSNFIIENDAKFRWQHDARYLHNGFITLFDNQRSESIPLFITTPDSRGLVLQLDMATMTAKLKNAYYHDPKLQISSMGNMQNLETGNKFIGWGESQNFSEYKASNIQINNPELDTIFEAEMPGNNYTYRAYRHEWTAEPCYPPSISVTNENGQITVYASWNGSTETTSWQVYAGNKIRKMKLIQSSPKTGFETAIPVMNHGPYFGVKALNSKCQVIGESKLIKIIKTL